MHALVIYFILHEQITISALIAYFCTLECKTETKLGAVYKEEIQEVIDSFS